MTKAQPKRLRMLRAFLVSMLAAILAFSGTPALMAEQSAYAAPTETTPESPDHGVAWYWGPHTFDYFKGPEDFTIENYTGTDEQREKLTEAFAQAHLASTTLQVTLKVPAEAFAELTKDDEAYVWEKEHLRTQDDLHKRVGELTDPFYHRYGYAAGDRHIGGLSVQYPDNGSDAVIIMSAGNHLFHSRENEMRLRELVMEMFAEGGELYEYRAENDLISDWEKYCAIYNWIRNNVVYGISHSAYRAVVEGGTFCDGYSALNSLLCAYAGVDNYAVVGYAGAPHAWSWVRIGEKWFHSDTTSNYLSAPAEERSAKALTPIDYSEDAACVLRPEFVTDEIKATYPAYTESFFDLLEADRRVDSGHIGDNLKWTLGDRVLTISGTGDMRDFEDPYRVPWRKLLDDIDKVVIKEGVTSIGANAFYGIEKIQPDDPSTVSIPSSVGDNIGKHAFYDPDDPITEFAATLETDAEFTRDYNGNEITPEEIVLHGTYGDQKASDDDYSARFKPADSESDEWSDGFPKDVGNYVVEVTLKGKIINGITYLPQTSFVNVVINTSFLDLEMIWAKDNLFPTYTYDGQTRSFTLDSASQAEVWFIDSIGHELLLGVDYNLELSYISSQAGTTRANARIIPLSDRMKNYTYNETEVVGLTRGIARKQLTADMFESIPAQGYTGSAITPPLSIVDSEASLLTYKDLTITYQNNISEGTAKAIVTGRNNYTGTVEIPFEISSEVEALPLLTTSVDGTLSQSISYPEALTFSLNGVPNGTTVSFVDKESDTVMGSATVSNGIATLNYSTQEQKLPVGARTVVAQDNTRKILAEIDLTVSPKEITASIPSSFYAMKYYDGTTDGPNESNTTSATGSTIEANDLGLKLDGVIEGDTLDTEATYTYDSPDPIKVSSITLTNIKLTGDDAAYYTLSTNELTVVNDSHDYFIPAVILKAPIVLETTAQSREYDGTTDVPLSDVKFTGLLDGDSLTLGKDYTITGGYDDGNAGKKTANLSVSTTDSEIWRYYNLMTDTLELVGEITPLTLNASMFNSIEDQVYTGTQLQPVVSLSGSNKLLTENDYEVTYGNNVTGSGTVTITGKNNFTGKVTLTFKILEGDTPLPDTPQVSLDADLPSQISYGDTLKLTGHVSSANPQAGTVELINGTSVLVSDVHPSADGSFTLSYDSARKTLTPGDHTLTIRYVTNEGAEATATYQIHLDAKEVSFSVSGDASRTYDGTTALPENHSIKLAVDELEPEDSDKVHIETTLAFTSADAGTKTVAITHPHLVDTDASNTTRFYTLTNTEDTTYTVATGIQKAPHTAPSQSVSLFEGSKNSTTLDLSGLIPENSGGTPSYRVQSHTSQGLASASITQDGTLSLTAKTESTSEMSDTVTVEVSGLKNYEDFIVIVTVSYQEVEKPESFIQLDPQQANSFTYGDNVTVSGSVVTSDPAAGTIALLYNNEQLAEVTPQENGRFSLTYDSAQKALPIGSKLALELRYSADTDKDLTATHQISLAAKNISFTVSGDATRVYNGTTALPEKHTIALTLTDVEAEDVDNLSVQANMVFAQANAGTRQILISNPTLQGSEELLAYYQLTNAPTSYEVATGIEKADLSETSTSAFLQENSQSNTTVDLAQLIPSDEAAHAVFSIASKTDNGLADATLDGSILTLSSKSNALASMTDTVKVRVSGLTNYRDAELTVEVSYQAAPLATISIGKLADTPHYSGMPEVGYTTLSATYQDAQGLQQTYNGPWEISYQGTTAEGVPYGPTAAAPSAAGSYTVKVSIPENQGLVGTASSSFNITAASLTIRVADVHINQGDVLPAFTYSVSGLVGLDMLLTEPNISADKLDLTAAGRYSLVARDAQASANYIITYLPGTLVVTDTR